MSSISSVDPGRPVEDDPGSQVADESSWIHRPVPPLIQRGQEAFRRDLPELMKKHEGKWVTYSGDRRIGITRTKSQAFHLGFKEGLTDHEFVARGITPRSRMTSIGKSFAISEAWKAGSPYCEPRPDSGSFE